MVVGSGTLGYVTGVAIDGGRVFDTGVSDNGGK